jgi:hypothetical protein
MNLADCLSGATQAPGRRLVLPDGDYLSGAPTKIWARRREIDVVVSRIATSAVTSDRGGWVPIRWEELRAALGCHTPTPTMDWLQSTGVLSCDHEYRRGRKAFWWRWGERIRSRPRRHRHVSDPASLRAWDAIRGIDPGVPEGPDAVRDHLRRWVVSLTLDPDKIADGLNDRYDDVDDPFYLKRLYARETADLMMHGEAEDKRGDYDRTAGRWHSAVTRSPRWMRSAMSIDGKSLWLIDCKSLQPLIQGLLSAREIQAGAAGDILISRDGCEEISNDIRPTSTDPVRHTAPKAHPIDPLKCTYLGRLSDLPDDLAEFFAIYAGGDFYRWLASEVLRMPCGSPAERDAVKEAWAHLVYCNPFKSRFVPGWPENWERYRARQPTIAGWLEVSKRSDHAAAAILCQQFEARVMLQVACRDLLEHHPGLPVITIHDAIMTTEAGIEIVEDALRRAWAAEGVVPRFKIEPA